MTEAEQMLADLKLLVCSNLSSDATRQDCIRIAFEIGVSEGRIAGAESMAETLTGSVNRALDNLAAAIRPQAG